MIPAHNDAGRLGDALASIADQTLPPEEIVVSDDASTDETASVVARFTSDCPIPVSYVRHEVRQGVVATRNDGIAASSGNWIANCDSDDYWAPTKLDRQVAFVRSWAGRPIALLGTHGVNVNDRRRVVSAAVMGPTTEGEYQKQHDDGGIFFVIHSSVLFARADYLAAGGYTDEYGAADDFHFFSKIGGLGVVVVVPEPLTYYRKRAGSIQLDSFWNQRYQLDRLTENEGRRVRGEPPLDYEAFMTLRTWDIPRWRNGYWRYGWSKYQFRRGSVEFVNGQRIRGAARLGLAALLGQDFGRTRRAALNAARYRLRQ